MESDGVLVTIKSGIGFRDVGKCVICSQTFQKQHPTSKCCSQKCRNEYYKIQNTKTCAYCGIQFSTYRDYKYCSWECANKGKEKRVDNTCLHCGKVFQTVPSEVRSFCSQLCGVKYYSPWTPQQEELLIKYYPTKQYPELEKIIGKNRKAIDHKIRNKFPELRKHKPPVIILCTQCSKPIKRYQSLLSTGKWGNFCSKECRGKYISENIVGEVHPNWKGGYYPYFGGNWQAIRQELRGRQKLVCSLCGISESKLDYELHAHHIIPRRKFKTVEDSNTLENLVLLCNKCHKEVENNGKRYSDMSVLRKTETIAELSDRNVKGV